MSILPELRQIACKVTRGAFERDHGGLYLLATLPSERDDLDFHTEVVHNPMAQAEDLLSGDAEQLLANNRLSLIAKTPRNPWQSKITIGRASNNDVIIRHPSVSKLHAYFEHPDGVPSSVVDVGSVNGTVINGHPALPDTPMAIAPGAFLQVGDVECELLDAPALYETIRSLFPTAELFRRV
jgi:FHA domain